MAEDIELSDFGGWEDRPARRGQAFINIPASESTAIHKAEDARKHYVGRDLKAQRQKLVETKVDAFLNVVADRDGLLPGPLIYDEFVLGKDGRTLYLKDGLKRVTYKNDSTRYIALKGFGKPPEWIHTSIHLFPDYKTTPRVPPRNRKTQAALTNVKNQLPAATETIELVDLPQRASDVDTAVKD